VASAPRAITTSLNRPTNRKSRVPAAKRVRHVALVVEATQAPRRQMLSGVAQYIQEHEPWAVYLKPPGVQKSLDEWLKHWDGDGIIAAVTETEIGQIAERGLPMVDVVGIVHIPNVPLVHANDASIGRLGAEHLLERGFSGFGFIEYGGMHFSIRRRDAFVETIRSRNFKCQIFRLNPPSGTGGPFGFEQQQSAMVDWIRALPTPVGVMASTDLLGQQFLEACLRAGVTVPEQVAVIGADNDEPICRIASPPLSSVIVNDHQRGYQAAAVLDMMMNGKPPPGDLVEIEPIGVACRASTDIMAIEDETVARALRFIRERACDGIGVGDVVRQALISRSVLERRFRKLVGRSVNEEIVRLRLAKAVELLSSTQMELKAIAVKTGFNSQSYMSAVFREKLNVTPGSYRRPGGNVRT
jgi:LacI family transcriptional regulator